MMRIVKDERYPDYALHDDDDSGWMPDAVLPIEVLTEGDLMEYRRVEALWSAWQTRLGQLYREYRPQARNPLGGLPERGQDKLILEPPPLAKPGQVKRMLGLNAETPT